MGYPVVWRIPAPRPTPSLSPPISTGPPGPLPIHRRIRKIPARSTAVHLTQFCRQTNALDPIASRARVETSRHSRARRLRRPSALCAEKFEDVSPCIAPKSGAIHVTDIYACSHLGDIDIVALFRGHSILERLMMHVWLTQVTSERTRAGIAHSATYAKIAAPPSIRAPHHRI